MTGLRIVTSWPDSMTVGQLEFTVVDVAGGKTLVAGQRLPDPMPDTALSSPSDVIIYFRDDLGGQDVRCDIRGLTASGTVGTAQITARLVAQVVVTIEVQLGSKPSGEPCTTGSECASNLCVDGVCCKSQCGLCQSCNTPTSPGTCAPLAEGTRHPGCADQGRQTCKFDGTCDGAGKCRFYPAGSECMAGACNGSSISSARACDGKGNCMPGPVVICAPFNCDPNGGSPRCFSRCTTNAECIPGRDCMSNSCGKKLGGAMCSDPSECASGFCTDGVCCDSKCDGPCVACNQTGSMGTCKTVASGQPDPHGVCKDQTAATCGTSGTCDGKGACAKYPVGTVCQQPSCMSATVAIVAGRCDVNGKCQTGGQLPCTPYVCRNGACVSTCTKNDDCTAPNTCDLGAKSCGKKGQGQACAGGAECDSTFCVDGVCCNTTCMGPCRSCSMGTVPGKCTMTPSGANDPRGSCTDQGTGSCGNDGTCDGNGACHKYPPGTVCGNQSCDTSSNTQSFAPTCDDQGKCTPGSQVTCGLYRCNGSSCFTACASDANCVAPNTCNSGTCGLRGSGQPCTTTANCTAPFTCNNGVCSLKTNGSTCTGDGQCASAHCTEGVCCDAADCGKCRSCKVNNFVGYCHPVPAGTKDPKNMCPAEAVSSCGRDGYCNGAGGCRMYAAGTECAPPSCNFAGDRINPKTCDGAGNCTDNGTTNCNPYVCNRNTNDCYTSCTSDAQCCCHHCRSNACF